MDDKLSNVQKDDIRIKLLMFSQKLLDIPYEYGAEWDDHKQIPLSLDCSELVEGVYNHFGIKMPDGSQNQHNFTIETKYPKSADLAFFGRGGNPNKIYHVGLVYDASNIIEARAFDPHVTFPTGKVILRPRERWENYCNFVGYRSHPKLV